MKTPEGRHIGYMRSFVHSEIMLGVGSELNKLPVGESWIELTIKPMIKKTFEGNVCQPSPKKIHLSYLT